MDYRETRLEMNKPLTERHYFVRVKVAEGHEVDFDARYNASLMSKDIPLVATSFEEAMVKAYTLFSPDDLTVGWVRFELYEEEVVSVRRLMHVADRPVKLIDRLHQKLKKVEVIKTALVEKRSVAPKPRRLLGFIGS